MLDGDLVDVFDGKLWKDFQTVKGRDFLKAPCNYGLLFIFYLFLSALYSSTNH